MASTQNFGLSKFPPGAITDEGNKFTLKDRELIDALLYTLFNHDHQAPEEGDVLEGFSPLVFPELDLDTAGTIPAGRTLYYKVAYLDINGNETVASATAVVATPAPLPPPPIPSVVVSPTGGTLVPGTYRYALSYYQGATAQTPATNIVVVTVPPGTNTNTITLTFATPPDEADGWKIYRRRFDENEHWLLATVADTEANYVDDGTVNADCTKRRPTVNTTNQNNSVTITIPASELPFDTRVKAWRIYKSDGTSSFGPNSLVATVTDTVTQGGSDLVTSYVDTGNTPGPGTPLSQSAVPPNIPQLDGAAFAASGARLPAALAPLGVRVHQTFLPGALTVRDYNRFSPQYDMLLTKLEAFLMTAATGVDGSNFVTIRISDDVTEDEVQEVFVTTTPRNEVQRVVKSIAANTWTLTFDGQTTAAIPAAPTTTDIKTALENLSNITTVNVTLVTTRTWDVEFVDPGGQDVVQMTGAVTGGTITVTTQTQGSDGGTFTLSDGVSTTSAIAFNASAATMTTRLETDIAAINDVTVTGTGTAADPWVITWVDPGGASFPILQMNPAGLNGTGDVTRVTRGHGPTSVDLVIDDTGVYHSWEAPTLLADSQEAEDAPATSTGSDVADANATDGQVTELDNGEDAAWPIGVLEAGVYIARFYVAPTAATRVDMRVIDTNGPSTLGETRASVTRPGYTPFYEVVFEADGVADIEFQVELITGTKARVDKYEWELILPTLHAGSTVTVEVLVTGSPSTNGSDVQFGAWY